MKESKEKIEAWTAGLRVLEDWGVKELYGIPAGSLNSLMDALKKEENRIRFIQVRHEETGALAASMYGKFTGEIGVCVGSAGPGATHLMNGLYDAKMDHVPVLAIVGQRPLEEVNMDAFQEMNHLPLFNDVAVFNRRVAYAEQLPKVIDEAVRTAMARKGVAVVEVPVSFGWEKIDKEESWQSSAASQRDYQELRLNEKDVDAAVELLNQAERPLIYAGKGIRGSADDLIKLSKKIKAPVAITSLIFDQFPYDFEALLGSAYRVGWKPANEALEEADVVLYVGSDFPFSEVEGIFDQVEKFIQIDIDQQKLGKRHQADAVILGDAGAAVRQITEKAVEKEDQGWYKANIRNALNWKRYLQKLETKTTGDLQFYQVYNAVNQVADADAFYSVDVGDVTQTSIRHLHMNPKNKWRTSEIFATMGNGLPGAIAAKLAYPEHQVWSFSGDGGFAMAMQDVVTAVTYKLPSIHVVFTNERFGFIQDEQEDTNENYFGVTIANEDFAKIAEAQGAKGYTVTEISQLEAVFKQAVEDEKNGQVVVIDAKITSERPLPVEALELDSNFYSNQQIKAFKKRYEAEELEPFSHFLKQEGLPVKQHKSR